MTDFTQAEKNYMKKVVDRFDLAMAHDTYCRMYYDDIECNEKLSDIWEQYHADMRKLKDSFQMGRLRNMCIDEFRDVVYP